MKVLPSQLASLSAFAAVIGCRAAFVVCGSALVGCGAAQEKAHPPPTYERWTLPDWAPPKSEEEGTDPTAVLSEMDGEWVVEPEEEGAPMGEGTSPENPEAPEGVREPSSTPPSADSGSEGPETAPLEPPPKDLGDTSGGARPGE